MKATITFENDQDNMRLFHAFLACSNFYSHDKNIIEFDRGDGITLKVDTTVAGITFGKKSTPWNERLGNENVDSGFMVKALLCYMSSLDNPNKQEELLSMEWTWGAFENEL